MKRKGHQTSKKVTYHRRCYRRNESVWHFAPSSTRWDTLVSIARSLFSEEWEIKKVAGGVSEAETETCGNWEKNWTRRW